MSAFDERSNSIVGDVDDFSTPIIQSKSDELRKYYPEPIAARPYENPETEAEVTTLSVKDSRPLYQFYLTQRRYDFTKHIELHDRIVGADKVGRF